MFYAFATLWYDRQRYLPGVLAVAFSALLIAMQCGILFGLLAVTSIPVDRSDADIWLGPPQVLSVDNGSWMSMNKMMSRIAGMDGVAHVEPYIQLFGRWEKPEGGTDMCIVVGCCLKNDVIGPALALPVDLREKLEEEETVVVDASELKRLGIENAPALLAEGKLPTAKISGKTVHVVGLVDGMKSIAGPYMFCSLSTARSILKMAPDQTIYVLAKCDDPAKAEAIVSELKNAPMQREDADMSVFTKEEFSRKSRTHWLKQTSAGLALGYAAILGLIVGAVVTSQTLYAATMASMREYAILLALGIPRWRLRWVVVTQAFWIGLLGVLLAVPVTYLMGELAQQMGVKPMLPAALMGSAAAVTLVMAVFSGVISLRSLRQIEPVNLLR